MDIIILTRNTNVDDYSGNDSDDYDYEADNENLWHFNFFAIFSSPRRNRGLQLIARTLKCRQAGIGGL